jgi:hypothetical protein
LTGPLLVWLAIQFLALLLALLRIPLAADYPERGEMLAAQVVVVAQVVASATLFPFLFRSPPAAVAVMVTACPFVVLGGVMSAVPSGNVAVTGAYLSAWLGALWAWKAVCPERLVGGSVAAATILTAGSVVLLYLRLDLSSGSSVEATEITRDWTWASPLLAALRVLTGPPRAQDWCTPSLIAVMAALTGTLAPRRRQVIHRV